MMNNAGIYVSPQQPESVKILKWQLFSQYVILEEIDERLFESVRWDCESVSRLELSQAV